MVIIAKNRMAEVGLPEAKLIRVQAMARGYITRWRYKKFRKHTKAMPYRNFRLLVWFFVLAKAWLNITLITTALELVTNPDAKMPDETSPHKTPFQKHPHEFGTSYQALVTSHVVTGFALVISMAIPLLSERGGLVHVIAGRAFLFFWCWHMVDGLVNASVVLLVRGYVEANYPKDGFSMWLYVQFAFIANCVCEFIINGLCALQFKVRVPPHWRSLLRVLSAATILHALVLVGVGVHVFVKGGASADAEEYAYIFVLEVPPYAYLCYLNYAHWGAAVTATRRMSDWLVTHMRNMMFCANLTLITGLANVTFRLGGAYTVLLWASQELVVMYWVWRMDKNARYRLKLAWAQYKWAKDRRKGRVAAVVGVATAAEEDKRAGAHTEVQVSAATHMGAAYAGTPAAAADDGGAYAVVGEGGGDASYEYGHEAGYGGGHGHGLVEAAQASAAHDGAAYAAVYDGTDGSYLADGSYESAEAGQGYGGLDGGEAAALAGKAAAPAPEVPTAARESLSTSEFMRALEDLENVADEHSAAHAGKAAAPGGGM